MKNTTSITAMASMWRKSSKHKARSICRHSILACHIRNLPLKVEIFKIRFAYSKMKYAFHPEARAEFLAAIDYYEECEPGLGADFAIEVHSTIRIARGVQ